MNESTPHLAPEPRRGSLTVSILACATAVTMVTVVAGAAAYLHPRLVGLAEEFDAELPTGSLLYLKIQPWRSLTAGGLTIVALALKEALITNKHVTTIINLVAIIVLIILGALLGAACLSPLLKLMQSIQ